MRWADVQAFLLGEWASIAGPSLYFAAGLAAATCAIWLLMNWRYGNIISSVGTRLSTAETRLKVYENAFRGATVAEAALRLKRLETYVAALPPRRLTEEQKRTIASIGCPPPGAPYVTVVHEGSSSEVRRYAHDFIEAFASAAGWNVVDHPYPMMPHPPSLGVAIGLADSLRPTPSELLVLVALRDAGIAYDILPKGPLAADVEIIVSAR